MIEAEELLKSAIALIPQKINDLAECPNGTTEQLCKYFKKAIAFKDSEIRIKSIAIFETPERATKLTF